MGDPLVLFVTRTYPPQIGGMERYSRDLYHALKDEIRTDLLANTRGRRYLPLFLIRCVFYLLRNGRKYTHIHFGDAVLAPLAYLAGSLSDCRVSITVHALDIIYDNRLYQLIIPYCLRRLDRIVAVSRYACEECVRRGVDSDRICVIPNGIRFSDPTGPAPPLQAVLEKYRIDFNPAEQKLLFSVGRLIRRKGIAWFVEKVMPQLPGDYLYLVAGTGPESDAITAAVHRENLHGRVHLPGHITESEKQCLYQHATLFIMPNVSIPGDAEGFGITIIEAAAFGLPAVAANIEGIPDTLIDGVTGSLVPERDPQRFVAAITGARFDRERIRNLTRQTYDWGLLAGEYRRRVFSTD